MTVSSVPLGDLIRPAKVERAADRVFPILSMTMRGGLVDQASKFKKRIASIDTSGYKVVLRNQLVVGFPIDEGVLSFQDLYDKAIVSPAYDVWELRAEREVEPRYLERFLRSPLALRYYMRKLRGTTARRRTLPDDVFLELEVPLPPAPEQRRLADALEKADSIRRRRKEAIVLADELLRSTFLEIFGDPISNPKGWKIVPLLKFGRITTGNTPPRAVPANFGDDIEWIKSDNINTSSHFLTRATEGLSKAGRAQGRTAPVGSTLMTCIAGSSDCIGNVAIADREVAFNQQINAITPNEGVDYRYLYVLLLVGKRLVQSASTNSMKGMVSKGRLEQVQVPSPPPSKQAQFGEAFDRILALSRRQEAAWTDSDRLFNAVLGNAFGEPARPRAGAGQDQWSA